MRFGVSEMFKSKVQLFLKVNELLFEYRTFALEGVVQVQDIDVTGLIPSGNVGTRAGWIYVQLVLNMPSCADSALIIKPSTKAECQSHHILLC